MTINILSVSQVFEAWKKGKQAAEGCDINSQFDSDESLKNGSKKRTIETVKKCLTDDDKREIDRLFKQT